MLQNTKHYLWDQEEGKDLKNSEKPADSSYRKISLVTLPMLGFGFDPWLGTKIPHAASCGKKKKKQRERERFSNYVLTERLVKLPPTVMWKMESVPKGLVDLAEEISRKSVVSSS